MLTMQEMITYTEISVFELKHTHEAANREEEKFVYNYQKGSKGRSQV